MSNPNCGHSGVEPTGLNPVIDGVQFNEVECILCGYKENIKVETETKTFEVPADFEAYRKAVRVRDGIKDIPFGG